jgi:TPR repeat protein
MYLKGLGVPKNEAIARRWIEKAARQGEGRAKTLLANNLKLS